jgi:hypothetical protein
MTKQCPLKVIVLQASSTALYLYPSRSANKAFCLSSCLKLIIRIAQPDDMLVALDRDLTYSRVSSLNFLLGAVPRALRIVIPNLIVSQVTFHPVATGFSPLAVRSLPRDPRLRSKQQRSKSNWRRPSSLDCKSSCHQRPTWPHYIHQFMDNRIRSGA